MVKLTLCRNFKGIPQLRAVVATQEQLATVLEVVDWQHAQVRFLTSTLRGYSDTKAQNMADCLTLSLTLSLLVVDGTNGRSDSVTPG